MQKVKIDINEIKYVSLHFDNGESKGYRKEELNKLTIQLSLGTVICFAVVNFYGRSLPFIIIIIIIRDIKKLHELLRV